MNFKKVFIGFYLVAAITRTMAQETKVETSKTYAADTATVNALLLKSKNLFSDAPEDAIRLSVQAKTLAETTGYGKGVALAFKNIGIGYYNQAKYMEALDNWTKSLHEFEAIKDEVGVANLLNNIGAVYMNQGDDEKALSYYLQSLKVSEQTGDTLRIVTAMNNVGAVYFHKKETYDKALEYYKPALQLSEAIGDDYGIGTTSVNLGEIYFERNNIDEALFYFEKSLKAYQKGSPESIPYSLNSIGKVYAAKKEYTKAAKYHAQALSISQKLNSKLDIVQSFQGLGNTYEKSKDIKAALYNYIQAETIGRQINSLNELQDIYRGLASLYGATSDFKNAFKYQALLTETKNSLYNIEADKKLASMQFDFDLKKKEGEITILKKNNSLRDLEIRRQRLAKNASIIGLAMAFILAFFIYRNYRIKAKSNRILDKKNVEIEGLLLNILPSEVASELQVTGHATPRHYENVSVLFTDFKGFTAIADKLSPEEVVAELNTCFEAFDDIVERHGLEKIKTIGDSYMCAGGIPSPDKDHVCKMVKASLEMLAFIEQYNNKRIEQGLPVWDIRIGIHVGPVVAGVVGKMKYAYDIWGSTVNIASRMESNGFPGLVNISAATYEQVKDNYACNYRGKIYAKNVGDIDMYFVSHEQIQLPQLGEKSNLSEPKQIEILQSAG